MKNRVLSGAFILVTALGCSKTKSAKPGPAEGSQTAAVVPPFPSASTPPAAASAEAPKPPAAPTVVATGQARPLLVRVDSANVYWVNQGSNDSGKPTPNSGSVMKLSKAGGEPVVLAPKQDMPTALAVDTAAVYWATTNSVRKVKTAGGGATTLYTVSAMSGIPTSLVLDDTTVYFGVLHAAKGGLFKVAKTGGGGGPVVGGDADSGFMVDDIALLRDRMLMCIGGGDILASVTLKTKFEKVLVKGLKKCQHLAADADDVYWTETSGGTVQRMPWMLMPNPSPMKVSEASSPTELVVNDGEVFWVEKSGRILRAPAHGGASSVVAVDLKSPQGLAVDDTYVYWASPEDGTVSRAARSPEASARAASAPTPPAASASASSAAAGGGGTKTATQPQCDTGCIKGTAPDGTPTWIGGSGGAGMPCCGELEEAKAKSASKTK